MRRLSFEGSEGTVVAHRWDPEGPIRRLVVLVHGYAEHGRRYAHVAEALAADGAVVVAPDHLGHGLSDGERALIDDFEHVVDDLRTLVELSLPGPDLPVVMIGHSMGGLLTARYVQRFGDLAGAAYLGAVIGDWDWARGVLALPELPPADSDPSGMSRDPEACRSYAEDPLVYHGTYKRRLLEAEVECLDRYAAAVDRLTVPTGFFHGTEDPFVPWQGSRAAVEAMPATDKELHVYEGARHELVNETNRDEVIADLRRWVARVAR